MAGVPVRFSGSFGKYTVALCKKLAKSEKRSLNAMVEVLIIEALETRKQQRGSNIVPSVTVPKDSAHHLTSK